MSNKISAPRSRSAKVSKARTAAIVSTGTIWVARCSGTTAVNCLGLPILRSKRTAPTRSGSRWFDLGSGVKPSVKTTASTSSSQTVSSGLGGPCKTSLRQWLRAFFRAGIQFKLMTYRKTQILPLRNNSQESTTDFSPKLRGAKHQLPFELAGRAWLQKAWSKDGVKSRWWSPLCDWLWSPAALPLDCG